MKIRGFTVDTFKMAQGLPLFQPFNINTTALDTQWKKWCSRLDNLLLGMDIQDEKRKRALLLYYVGEDVNDIFDTLQDTGDDYGTAKSKLTEYFAPKKCTEYEIYKFRQASQEQNETVDAYHTRLRQLSENCEFADRDKEIKSQIILGCTSTRLRRKALKEEITLDTLIKEARMLELSEKQATEIERNKSTSANIAFTQRRNKKPTLKPAENAKNKPKQARMCRNCGGSFPHSTKCPAQGKECYICHKKNHFGKMCRQKKTEKQRVHNMEEFNHSDSDIGTEECEYDYCFGLLFSDEQDSLQQKTSQSIKTVSTKPMLKVTIDNNPINVLIDTGSSINVLDEQTYNNMFKKPKLSKTNTVVQAYGTNNKVTLIGKFQGTIETKQKYVTAPVFVAKGQCGNLLCYNTAVDLQVIPEINAVGSDKVTQLCEKYSSVFTGLGKMKDMQIDLHVDNNVQPVAQPHRRIPFHVREKVEKELKRLEDLDIIERVEGPTPWVSPIVVAPKPKSKTGEIRICVDMRQPNQAIKRTRHIIPTIDDMIVDLNGSKIFSKLDLNQGYHQLELAESSRNITTFTTHVGLRRYKRLNFGVTSAAEIFQNMLRTTLEGIDGARNISDDIIVYGRTQTEHDQHLEAVLRRLHDKGLTLNRNKCEFNKNRLEFFGYIFGQDGLSADPKKCETIKNTQPPTNISEVRSFLAMTNYVSRFIPHYSTITEPLRRLTKKNVQWQWTHDQANAFQTLKDTLSSDTIMTYFNPNKQTEIITDASPVGISAIMLQENRVISYASKALTDVEKRYSQTEKENYAIVWAVEHFHIYLFGHKFTLITDAKALENIYNNPKSKPPARLERWRMRLLAYDFEVKYRPGESNMSDYLSRHPDAAKSTRSADVAEEYLSFIAHQTVPKAMTIDEIIEETTKDVDLQTTIQNVRTNSWQTSYKSNSILDTYSRCKNELTVVTLNKGTVVLHGTRLVIPKSLQQKVINIAHEGHQGIVKTKQMLREKVYFPGIDQLVEKTCKSCIPCLAATDKTTHEPLQMSPLPSGIFEEISLDFCGPFPNGQYFCVVVDEYSRYPIVKVVNSINAKTILPILDEIMSEYGIPRVVKTDNGPPMNGKQFEKFAEYFGFQHRKITPLWPQANAECERMMKNLVKTARAANIDGIPLKQGINAFLRNYRATPHTTTKQTPYELFFGRQMYTKLPNLPSKANKLAKHLNTKFNDQKGKQQMKQYADKRRKAKHSNLQVGDKVLVKQDKQNKLTPPYDPKPFEIVKKKGTMITAKREDKHITRNSSKFKPVQNAPAMPGNTDEETDTIPPDLTSNVHNQTPEPRRSTRIRKPPAYLKDYVSS